MKLEENIQKVSLVFFLIVGLAHITAHLMAINGYYENMAVTLRRVLDIPFIIIAATYGLVSLKISLESSEKKHTISNILIIIALIAIFAAVIYLNLFIPDRV